MNDLHFDSLTRRASLTTLGVVGLAALASPFTATARQKHKHANKKREKTNKAKERCETQVAQCTDFIAASCPGDAACVAKFQPCCTFSGQCDFTEFITCLQQTLNV
jgi:hypothetical protein